MVWRLSLVAFFTFLAVTSGSRIDAGLMVKELEVLEDEERFVGKEKSLLSLERGNESQGHGYKLGDLHSKLLESAERRICYGECVNSSQYAQYDFIVRIVISECFGEITQDGQCVTGWSPGICTGTVYGSFVLTAHHCVQGQQPGFQIHVFNIFDQPLGSAAVHRYHTGKDMVILRLLGSQYYPRSRVNFDRMRPPTGVSLTVGGFGYNQHGVSGQFGVASIKFTGCGTFSDLRGRTAEAGIADSGAHSPTTIYKGDSGAPWFYVDDDNGAYVHHIIGVHHSGTEFINMETWAVGSQDNYNQMKKSKGHFAFIENEQGFLNPEFQALWADGTLRKNDDGRMCGMDFGLGVFFSNPFGIFGSRS